MTRPVGFPPTRRTFLAQTAAGVAASTLLKPSSFGAAPPSERVRVGVIGSGNQGKRHQISLTSLPDVEVVYVCDIDKERLAEGKQRTQAPHAVTDLRRILDDDSIDGVTIAAPDHWHVPAALLALEAGKHVYVEKPCSQNFREGQLLVAAAKKARKVVQHGTQSRSCTAIRQAVDMLRDGLIGDVLIAKCWNWQRRNDIGRQQPSDPPTHVDYDTWVGPAEWLPYQSNRFHYDWHWWFNFGSGGMGNDAVHELDYAMWGLGVDNHPTTVSGTGGIYYFDDDRQWPDTQQVTLEYADGDNKKMLIYEQRLWSTSYPFNVDAGAEFYGKKGKMFLSKRGKMEVRDDGNARVDVKVEGDLSPLVEDHQQNWVDCIKSGKTPNAPVELANQIATAIHLGNISTRLNRSLQFDPKGERIVGDAEATDMLTRKYRAEGHWSIPKGV